MSGLSGIDPSRYHTYHIIESGRRENRAMTNAILEK